MAGSKLAGDNPLRYEDAETGADIPVRYYTDILSGAVVAFIIHDGEVQIKQMRSAPGKFGEPLPDKVALKAFLGTNDIHAPATSLAPEDLQRIQAGSTLEPKKVL